MTEASEQPVMADTRDDQPVYVGGLCIVCQRPPATCPAVIHGCLAVGLLLEMRSDAREATNG